MIQAKYSILFLSLYSIFFLNSAYSQVNSCDTKINQNEAVNKSNIRDQDSTGWCYAYAASELLSYELKTRISAVSLYDTSEGSLKNDILFRSDIGGNIYYSIVNSIRKRKGLCLEEDLPSSDFQFALDHKYFDLLDDLIYRIDIQSLEQDLKVNQCLKWNLNQAFPNIDMNKVLTYINNQGQEKVLEYIQEMQCKIQFQAAVKKIEVRNLYHKQHSKDKMLAAIDSQLSKNSIAAIDYEYNSINNKYQGRHASVVIGRQKNTETGVCEYLVRNSWGQACDINEKPGLRCDYDCQNGLCRTNGHFWISGDQLKQTLFNVTFINK